VTQTKFRRVEGVTNADISNVWDRLAPTRYHDVTTGRDRSYTEVLFPLVEDFLRNQVGGKLMDAGCGVGFVSRAASRYFESVDAIDLSPISISIAKEENYSKNVRYHISSIENFCREGTKYDALISSMVLMDCLDHKTFLNSCCSVLKPGARMMFTLCHPFFWPRYWGFERYSWFAYNSEIAIESNFKTSSTGLSGSKTIYFHRPISAYVNALFSGQASITSVREVSGLSVNSRILDRFPRYLAIEAVRIS
jgi:SAM-dependent methyltransferase